MNEISKRIEPVAPAAVITGATQGLGKALAEEIARAGHPLRLAARDETALAAAAKAIAESHNVEVKFVAADLCTVEGCDAVEKALARSGLY
ncbi:MAG: SDR family NAD(P)-dependent oxidoreductase, partial [Methyloceanibacter sp.]